MFEAKFAGNGEVGSEVRSERGRRLSYSESRIPLKKIPRQRKAAKLRIFRNGHLSHQLTVYLVGLPVKTPPANRNHRQQHLL